VAYFRDYFVPFYRRDAEIAEVNSFFSLSVEKPEREKQQPFGINYPLGKHADSTLLILVSRGLPFMFAVLSTANIKIALFASFAPLR
jgi:hypothetical protein